jgi:hypothetical protein
MILGKYHENFLKTNLHFVMDILYWIKGFFNNKKFVLPMCYIVKGITPLEPNAKPKV